MNKTTSITIGGIFFHLTDDAYETLSAYLGEVSAYMETLPGGEEVMRDIEARIAEELHHMRKKDDEVITKEQVEKIKAQMGSVKDFEVYGDEETSGQVKEGRKESAKKARRLYRDPENGYLGGVLAGIGHYCRIDPVAIRGLFVLFLIGGFVTGTVFLIFLLLIVYVLLWIVLPTADTSEKKANMMGGKVPTLRSIQEKAGKTTNGISRATARYRGKGITGAFRRFKSVISALFRAGFIVVGAGIGLFAFGAAVFTLFLAVLFALGSIPWYIDFPIAEMAYGTVSYFVVLVTGTLLVIIPLLVAMQIGVFFIWRKLYLKKTELIGIAGIWVLSLVISGAVFAQAAPQYIDQIKSENQSALERSVPVPAFSSVYVNSGILFDKVNIQKGSTTKVEMSGTKGVLDKAEVSVRADGVLTVRRSYQDSFCILCRPLFSRNAFHGTLTITSPELMSITVPNHTKVNIDDFALENLSLNGVFGTVAASAEKATISMYQNPALVLTGSIKNLDLSGFGGKLIATSTPIENAEVYLDYDSDVTMAVSETLSGTVLEGNVLRYIGEPEVSINTDEDIRREHRRGEPYRERSDEDLGKVIQITGAGK